MVDVRTRGAIGVVQLHALTHVDWLKRRFVEEGVWLRPVHDVVYTTPPFVIDDADLTRLTDGLVRVVGEWSQRRG